MFYSVKSFLGRTSTSPIKLLTYFSSTNITPRTNQKIAYLWISSKQRGHLQLSPKYLIGSSEMASCWRWYSQTLSLL